MSLSKPIDQLSGNRELVVGSGHASFFVVSSFVDRECWRDEDAPVIHMGIIVGMWGVSIRM